MEHPKIIDLSAPHNRLSADIARQSANPYHVMGCTLSSILETRMNAMKSAVQTGFTLIELMIAIVVVGILSAIAYPSYSDYVVRSKLPEATSALASMRIKAEQYFADNRQYTGMESNCSAWAGALQYFSVDCGTPTASAYTFSATGSGGGMQGFAFSVNQDNARTTTIASPAPASWQTSGTLNCWITNKGQTC